ncbi:MAG: hypothetical protein KGL59_04765 [Acidobacteriota bacterium]|nr:hypothetical protein [Acidobacteriota bacterium]
MRVGKGLGGKIGIGLGAAAGCILSFSQSAWAQGCVLCYTSASALNKSAAHELDKAIITLFIPPALIFIGIFAYIYRRRSAWRNATREESLAAFGPKAQLEASGHTRI